MASAKIILFPVLNLTAGLLCRVSENAFSEAGCAPGPGNSVFLTFQSFSLAFSFLNEIIEVHLPSVFILAT